MNPRNPWSRATKAGRDYLTPEDVDAAIKAGAKKLAIYGAVLKAIESGASEDPSACAYVALRGQAWSSKARMKSLGLLDARCPECGSIDRMVQLVSHRDRRDQNGDTCNHAWHAHTAKKGKKS